MPDWQDTDYRPLYYNAPTIPYYLIISTTYFNTLSVILHALKVMLVCTYQVSGLPSIVGHKKFTHDLDYDTVNFEVY